MPHDVVTVWVTTVRGLFLSRKDCKIIFVLLTRRDVKMIGFTRVLFSFLFLFFFFFAFFMDQGVAEKRGYYSAILTDKAWKIKVLLYGKNISL